jgi:VCBS repeat-containing protein
MKLEKINLKSAIRIISMVLPLFVIGFGQGPVFTYVDSVFQYTEGELSNHKINFSDSDLPLNSEIGFEFSGLDTSWIMANSNVFGSEGEYWINFFGRPEDENFADTLFSLTILNNATGLSNMLEFIIQIESVEDYPISYDLIVNTDEDSEFSGNVPSATDDDIEGIDLNGYTLIDSVLNGSLTFTTDGSFTFNPLDDFQSLLEGEFAEEFFTYTATDVSGLISEISTITITINGINDLPVTNNLSLETNEDVEIVGNIPEPIDIDSDGINLNGYSLIENVSIGDLTFNNNGSFTFNPQNDFQYLLNGESTQVSFTYIYTDLSGGESNTSTVDILITGNDDFPVTYNSSSSVDEDNSITQNVPEATDDDLNGINPDSYSLINDVNNGSLLFNNDGSFSFDPLDEFQSMYEGEITSVSFSYTVNDMSGLLSNESIITIYINGLNDIPISYNSINETDEDSILEANVIDATDIDSDGININGYALVNDVASGSLIFNSNGSFLFNPIEDFQFLTANSSTNISFKYTASDNQGVLSDTSTVEITILGVNDNPISFNFLLEIDEDTEIEGNVPIPTDIDSDGININGYTLVNDVPSGNLIFNNDGTFIYYPENDFQYLLDGESTQINFTYTATDSQDSLSNISIIYISINGISDAPIIITNPTDLSSGFGDTYYSDMFFVKDVDSPLLNENSFLLHDILVNEENYSVNIDEINFENNIYYIKFSLDSLLPANLLTDIEFSLLVTDQTSLSDSKNYNITVYPNSAPVPHITSLELSGISGQEIDLFSETSTDVDDDINSYFWSVNSIIRHETFIDINNNGIFDLLEPYNDINLNGIFEPEIEFLIEPEIINYNNSISTLLMPQTFEDTDVVIELKITDSKGAIGTTSTIIRSINPRVELNNISGNQGEVSILSFGFVDLLNEPIFSIDLEFRWNIDEVEITDEIDCTSLSYFPSVIGDSVSINLPEFSNDVDFQINDLESGKLALTIYSSDDNSLNNLLINSIDFAELNIPLTGFHNEEGQVFVSRFDINEQSFSVNSNLDSLNGIVTISGEKLTPFAGFIVKNEYDEIITTSDNIIYSGTKLYFDIITECEGPQNPFEICDSLGHELLGNGLEQNYSWDFDNDGEIDEQGTLNGSSTSHFTYSITGFDTIPKTAILNIETAYGCASAEFEILVDPLVPTMVMSTSGDPWNYDGEPASLLIKINQTEDLEGLDLIIDYNSEMINIVSVENLINSGIPNNLSVNYEMVYNINDNQVNISVYSNSNDNYTFFSETADFPFALVKYYALQPGNVDISVSQFDVDEYSFLNILGDNSLFSFEIANPNEGIIDCNDELGGSSVIDQCGICTGGNTQLIPNETQDCQGTCMPTDILEIIEVEIFDSTSIILCNDSQFGYNPLSDECELYIGLESQSPTADENGFDLCGICGGNNIELNGQFIGSDIDCNGYCSASTPNANDQFGFCGCIDDSDGLYPDINGICKNGLLPVEETGLCSDIFDDINQNGEWDILDDSLLVDVDLFFEGFNEWGYKYLNYSPESVNDDGSCSRGIVINEFFFSPVQGTAVPDYIELLNMTPFDINMNDWRINDISISDTLIGYDPIILAGRHLLISTGLPFYNESGDMLFPGNCDETSNLCSNIPNSMMLNINLGMNSGIIHLEDIYGTMDYLSYSDESYWSVGAPFIGHSVELIEPYKSRNISSNWKKASEYFSSPYMATEDGEWEAGGGYNYGTPASYNIAYDDNHDEVCIDEINPNCELTKYDCANIFNGLAFEDLCSVCSGGSTGIISNIFDEEAGMCIGDPTKIDCACTCFNESNFGAVIDDCGSCTLGNAGSFDYSGLIVEEPNTSLNCESTNGCELWGMVCNPQTDLCHHAYNGHQDICGTCRMGPECDENNIDECDDLFNLTELFIDSNENGIYDLGEDFIDANGDNQWNDGADDCGICTMNVSDIYEDSNGDNIISPCYDGYFDIDNYWVSNCPDWESAFENNCVVDCMGDVNESGQSDEVNAITDDCGECVICETEGCIEEENWNNSCVYDFTIETDMNIPGIVLNWSPINNYDYYKIYKNEDVFIDSLFIDEIQFIDEDVEYLNEYCYWIEAFSIEGDISNPSPVNCAQIDYFGNLILEDFQFHDDFGIVNVSLNISHDLDTVFFHINESVSVDSLKLGIFSLNNQGYNVDLDSNNIKIYPSTGTTNFLPSGILNLGDLYFTPDSTDFFCIDSGAFHPVYDVLFSDGFIVQLPDCETFGCNEPTAFNYDIEATVNDGSCLLPHYILDIEPTGNSQSMLILSDIEQLEVGDHIGIFDGSGIVSQDCPAEFGELLVGEGFFNNENLTIEAIRATPCIFPFEDPASMGFVPNHEIIVKVWRESEQFEMVYSISEQGHSFGGIDITIEQLNIPLYYELEIEETGNSQSIIFNESLPGLEVGDNIGIFDYNAVASPDCPTQFDTLLVGSGYYTGDILTIDAIRATPCSPFSPDDPAELGFTPGGNIIIKVWRESLQLEYIMNLEEPLPIFGQNDVFINPLLSINNNILPNQYQLYPIFPNPFNPVATIQYDISEYTNVTIEVFDVLGKRVDVLFSGMQYAGGHMLKWNGHGHSTGLYLIRMTSNGNNFIEKVMLVK